MYNNHTGTPVRTISCRTVECNCGCGNIITPGEEYIIHVGSFYIPTHYNSLVEQENADCKKFDLITKNLFGEQTELVL